MIAVVIAKAEPVIANEVLQLQTRLREAFAGTPEKLAASEPDQFKREALRGLFSGVQ